MNIITISREFGSGGREVGKRLADELGYAYYDREIVTAIAQKHQLDEHYVASTLDKGVFSSIPIHFGRTLSYTPVMSGAPNLLAEQNTIIRELAAKGNCIIVGRAADTLLEEHHPFNLFVYADMPAKVRRCQQRAGEDEKKMTDREMERRIKRIDAERARYHDLFSHTDWGRKEGYHLCVNTTDIEIKTMIPSLAQYIRCWFDRRG